MKPYVSIIIPNYNHVEFLARRLESVFNQSFQNFEVIILDDNSTDGSWEYLESYIQHPKVSYCIRNGINSGSTFSQWKKGLDLAKYEWIWIAESDDYSELDFLEFMVSKIRSNFSLIYCSSFFVDENNVILDSKFPNWEKNDFRYKRWNNDYMNSGFNEIYEFLSFKNTIINTSSVIFKKPDYFPSELLTMKYCGDWYFWIFLLKDNDVFFLSKKLNYFRKHSRSSTFFVDIGNEIVRISEISKCINFARDICEIKLVRVIDFKHYSGLARYYAWNFKKWNLPFSTFRIFPKFITIQIGFHYLKHVIKKISFRFNLIF